MNGMSISTDRFTITMRNVDVPPSSVVSTLDLRDVQLVNTGEYQCRATNNLTTSSDEVFTSEAVLNFTLTVLSKCAICTTYTSDSDIFFSDRCTYRNSPPQS